LYSKIRVLQFLPDNASQLMMGFDPESGRVNFLLLLSSQVSHLWFGFGKFPLKISNFSIFSTSGQNKISSGWVKKYPCQRRVCLLFSAGQKYAWVGSGPISIHNNLQILFQSQVKLDSGTGTLNLTWIPGAGMKQLKVHLTHRCGLRVNGDLRVGAQTRWHLCAAFDLRLP